MDQLYIRCQNAESCPGTFNDFRFLLFTKLCTKRGGKSCFPHTRSRSLSADGMQGSAVVRCVKNQSEFCRMDKFWVLNKNFNHF